MAAKEGEGEWPHHQILRAHRLYAFRQHLHIQDAVPYLLKRKAIPKSLAREISNYPLQKNDDYNINFLLAYLREAGVERFVRFIEGLGDSISPALGGVSKSHAVLIDTMSENLEKISNADVDQVRRVRAVLKLVRGLRGLEEEVEEGVEEDKGYGQSFEFLSPQMVTQSNTKEHNETSETRRQQQTVTDDDEMDSDEKEDKESRKLLEQAMKLGYVNITLVKVIVEGPAGVGKTSVIYLLLSKSPPENRHSTSCVERAIRVVRVGKEGEKWKEISTEEFEEAIAEAVPILYKELRAKGKGMEELESVLSDLNVGEEQGERERSMENEETREGEGSRENNALSGSQKGKAVIDRVIKKLTKLVGSGKSSSRLLDMELIYLTDTGGQQPFWDLIPIFTYDTSATLFVHRLCEKLDEHPVNDLYQRGKHVGPSQRATLTTSQAFKTVLQGVYKEKSRPKIIAVGTHKDLMDDCEETLEKKNKLFTAIVSGHFKKDIIFRNEALKEIVFPVNTKTPGKDDEKEGSKIRAIIEKEAKQHKIPIWWFILQLILESLAHKLGRDVLSKVECLHVSNSLGFSEKELDAALCFFDKLNIFLFKKNILPTIVFTNPQVPLDKLSVIIQKQHQLKAAEADQTKAADIAMVGEWQSFRDQGILSIKCLEEFKSHFVQDIFTTSDFLQLLEKLLIICRLPANEYFFPAVLSMTSESRIKQFLVSHRITQIAALVMEFSSGWAPPGVYCCSVCHLQSHAHWEVVHKPLTAGENEDNPDTQLCKIFRNSITFRKRGRPGSVTFIDNFSFFIVCVNVDTTKMEQDELVEHCQTVKSDLFRAVWAALENTHHAYCSPKPAFLCPYQNESCSTELHSAHLSDNCKKWICSENSDVFDRLSSNQTFWVNGAGPNAVAPSLDDQNLDFQKFPEPDLPVLMEVVGVRVQANWRAVGSGLGLKDYQLDTIQQNHQRSVHFVQDCMSDVFSRWRDTQSSEYSWRNLVKVLMVGNEGLLPEIYAELSAKYK